MTSESIPTVPQLTDAQKKATLFALLIVFLLSALDMTILSTAMPKIIEALDGLELYAWVSTAYMLTSTILVPICGKLGDLYGRKKILLWGLAIFLLGSVLSGLSGEFGTLPILGDGIHQLIIFRALKGVGGAALFTCVIAIIADIYAPRERARFMGLFGAIFGVSSILGPAIGGFLTDYANTKLFGHEIPGWRWVFYVNIPLGIFSFYLLLRKTPNTNHPIKGAIDYVGAALFIGAFIPLLLALTWGGHQYAWDSKEIISMFVGSAVALELFLIVEAKVSNPILPLSLFKNKVFSITNTATFVIGMSFLGIVMFMPLYMQVVQGISASKSGFSMFPMMFGMMVGSIVSGRLVSQYGIYKSYMVSGAAVLIVGVYLFLQIGPDTSVLDLSWRMLIVGLGLGPSQGLSNLVVQSAVQPMEIGVATSATQFFRQIGSTIGIAIFGTFLTNNLAVELPKQLPQFPGGAQMEQRDELNLSAAQSDAMNPEKVRERIHEQFDVVYQTIEKAMAGDVEATQQLQSNPAVPDLLKNAVSVGATKSAADRVPILANIKSALHVEADKFADSLTRGTKVAFSNAITGMYSAALWIVILGFIITCFIPVIPLRSQNVRTSSVDEQQKSDAAS